MNQTLPPLVNAKLQRLGQRIAIDRALHLLLAALMTLTLGFLGVMAADAFFGLTIWHLRVATLMMAGFVASVLACVAIQLMFRRPRQAVVAAFAEHRFPAIDERLLTLIHLPENEPASPLLVALQREAAEKTESLDFRQAWSFGQVKRLGRLAGGAVVVTLLLAFFWPAGTRSARRLLLAWSPAVHGYELTLSPTFGFAAQGRPLLLEAELRITTAGTRFPERCVALVREDAGQLRRLPMEATSPGRYAAVVEKMPAQLSYQVMAGELESAEMAIEGVASIQLAAGSPQLKILPPPYVAPQVMPAAGEIATFSVVQYSTLTYQIEVDRPAENATFTWQEAGQTREIPLVWSQDRLNGTATIVAATSGPSAGTLILGAGHGITTIVKLGPGQVWADLPPRFVVPMRIAGMELASTGMKVAPEELLRLQATVEAVVGLDRVELEYRVNDGPSRTELLEDAKGQRHLSREWVVPLRGKVKSGDRFQFRLRAVDNRRLEVDQLGKGVPGAPLEPQITLEPSSPDGVDHWVTLTIQPKVDPLEMQHIQAQHDDFAGKLRGIRKDIEAERSLLDKTIRGNHGSSVWLPDQARGLDGVRKSNTTNQESIRLLAARAGTIRGLEPLSRLSRDVAERDLASADRSLGQAEPRDLEAARRERELRQADGHLQSALERIDELLKVNDVLAQERLHQMELEHLALREDELVKEAAQLSPLDPKSIEKELERLRAQQDALARQLEEWAKKHPQLKNLSALLQKMEAQALAQKAQQLAKLQQSQSQARAAELQEKLKKALAEVAVKQAALADRIARLDRDLRLGIELPNLVAPTEPAYKAAHQLREAQVENALAEQSRSHVGLTQLEDKLNRTILQGGDAQKAAAKLAEAQAQLVDDLEQLGKDFARLAPEEIVKRLAGIFQRQKDVHQGVGKLNVPASSKEAQRLKGEANEAAEDAIRLLGRKDLLQARDAMEKARDALRQLSKTLPSSPELQDAEREKLAEKTRLAGLDKSRDLARKQKLLQDETLKVLADLMKSTGPGNGGESLGQAMQELQDELKKLAQKMADPDAQALAKQSSQAADEAGQGMKNAQDERDKGQLSQAEKSEEDAAFKLQMAGQKMDEAAMKSLGSMPPLSDDDRQLAESFQQSQKAVNQAKMSNRPPSPGALESAAKSLHKTAELNGNQTQRRWPQPGPAAAPSSANLTGPLPPTAGQAWGNLPGELRTRLIQDLRTRYGEDYEAIIQRFFNNLSQQKK